MSLTNQHTLNDAKEMYRIGRITWEELRAWLPGWCVGKCEYRWHNGMLQSWHNVKYSPEGGYWMLESWATP